MLNKYILTRQQPTCSTHLWIVQHISAQYISITTYLHGYFNVACSDVLISFGVDRHICGVVSGIRRRTLTSLKAEANATKSLALQDWLQTLWHYYVSLTALLSGYFNITRKAMHGNVFGIDGLLFGVGLGLHPCPFTLLVVTLTPSEIISLRQCFDNMSISRPVYVVILTLV